jgi:hypothetical protein
MSRSTGETPEWRTISPTGGDLTLLHATRRIAAYPWNQSFSPAQMAESRSMNGTEVELAVAGCRSFGTP